MADPIHQFEIRRIFTLAKVGAPRSLSPIRRVHDGAAGLTRCCLSARRRSRTIVPSRLQSVAELSYELIATTLRSTAGSDGMKFFPFVLSLFMFILVANLIGLVPYAFHSDEPHHHHGLAGAGRVPARW